MKSMREGRGGKGRGEGRGGGRDGGRERERDSESPLGEVRHTLNM